MKAYSSIEPHAKDRVVNVSTAWSSKPILSCILDEARRSSLLPLTYLHAFVYYQNLKDRRQLRDIGGANRDHFRGRRSGLSSLIWGMVVNEV